MAPRKDGTAREAGAISLSQASTNFGHSSARLRRIKKLQFGIINPEELRQYSVTQAITVNGRKIPAGVTRYEVSIIYILLNELLLFLFYDGVVGAYGEIGIVEVGPFGGESDAIRRGQGIHLRDKYYPSVTNSFLSIMNPHFYPNPSQTYMSGQPVYGGVNDPRLGDLHDKSDPGYFGHIELARPVYHQGFIDVTLKALRCVCFHCSRITMEDTEYKFQRARQIRNRKRRLDAM